MGKRMSENKGIESYLDWHLAYAERKQHQYQHIWITRASGRMLVDRCVCGVIRNIDGSNDHAICSLAVSEGLNEVES
jgi:hypothetical protein